MASSGGPGFEPETHRDAVIAAARRIIPARKTMRLEDAEAILRTEFALRDAAVSPETVTEYAMTFLRGPFWVLPHPRQARREGVGLEWPWGRGDTTEVPLAVEELANHEAWRCAGHGVGPLAEGLEPAECQRVSKSEYFCVAEVQAEDGHSAWHVDIRISYRRGDAPKVIDAVLKHATGWSTEHLSEMGFRPSAVPSFPVRGIESETSVA